MRVRDVTTRGNFAWVGFGLVCLVALLILGFGLNWFGLFSQRVLYKTSFQYKEARQVELATYESQLVEIEAQLRRTDLDQTTRNNLEAQAAAIRVRINTARRRQ